ncbi:hypothetical protein TcWFU_005634 [Taenia crassiceps]|uniref:Uncharacterized protein n=1 Tax=Taenia crassiceps TaxID=6207 RepID=A0ABR4QHE8_9CEST
MQPAVLRGQGIGPWQHKRRNRSLECRVKQRKVSQNKPSNLHAFPASVVTNVTFQAPQVSKAGPELIPLRQRKAMSQFRHG